MIMDDNMRVHRPILTCQFSHVNFFFQGCDFWRVADDDTERGGGGTKGRVSCMHARTRKAPFSVAVNHM